LFQLHQRETQKVNLDLRLSLQKPAFSRIWWSSKNFNDRNKTTSSRQGQIKYSNTTDVRFSKVFSKLVLFIFFEQTKDNITSFGEEPIVRGMSMSWLTYLYSSTNKPSTQSTKIIQKVKSGPTLF
jgi:hypothetical protein